MIKERCLPCALAIAGLVSAQAQTTSLLNADYDLRSKGVLLQVTENVPVFLRADPKSARLANAEAGTVLLVIDLSPKRSWVQIEDDQGTRGWVPVERTDLQELLEAQVKIRRAQIESAESQLNQVPNQDSNEEEVQESRYQSDTRIIHVLGPAYLFAGGPGWGALYSLLFDFQVPERGGVRQRTFGFEAAWFNLKPTDRFETRVRYSSRLPGYARITYGPDVSVRLANAHSRTAFVAAYRLGYDVLWRFPLELRAGLSTESQHRWLTEISWRMRF